MPNFSHVDIRKVVVHSTQQLNCWTSL